jgi:hypothetical protein
LAFDRIAVSGCLQRATLDLGNQERRIFIGLGVDAEGGMDTSAEAATVDACTAKVSIGDSLRSKAVLDMYAAIEGNGARTRRLVTGPRSGACRAHLDGKRLLLILEQR